MRWRDGNMLLQALGLHGPAKFVVAPCIFPARFASCLDDDTVATQPQEG